MDITGIQPIIKLRLHRFGLGFFLGLQTFKCQHIEEVGIASCIQLVSPIETDTTITEQARQCAMNDGGTDLALDIVSYNR